MEKKSSSGIDESTLTKGQRRKLSALRKSVGDEIGERAFDAWRASRKPAAAKGKADENAALVAETLWSLIEEGRLAIPRGRLSGQARPWPCRRRACEVLARVRP